MSANGDAMKGAAPGNRGGPNDGAKGITSTDGGADRENSGASQTDKIVAARQDFDAAARVCPRGQRPALGERTPVKPRGEGATTAMMAPPIPRRYGRRGTPWIDVAVLAAACLFVAAIGSRIWRSDISDYLATKISSAARPGDDTAEAGQALARERARGQAREQELALRQAAAMASPPAASGITPASLTAAPASDAPAPPPLSPREATPMPAPAADKTDKGAATPAPAASDKPPPASGTPYAVRLMARARLLLDQGDIGSARIVLERAAESGSALALFTLAETYDPAVLAAWRTVGTRGDVAKAQQLYAQALAGGVEAARDRLEASR